jgi:hypothetical protein
MPDDPAYDRRQYDAPVDFARCPKCRGLMEFNLYCFQTSVPPEIGWWCEHCEMAVYDLPEDC